MTPKFIKINANIQLKNLKKMKEFNTFINNFVIFILGCCSGGQAFGIVVGVIGGLAIVIGLVVYFMRKGKKKPSTSEPSVQYDNRNYFDNPLASSNKEPFSKDGTGYEDTANRLR